MLLRCIIIFFLLAIAVPPNAAQAQIVPDTSLNNIIDDTLAAQRPATTTIMTSDSLPVIAAPVKDSARLPFQPVPKRAALFSALIPGMGQIYNRQYWKAPLIYAGMAATGYFLIDNTNNYRKYRSAYIARIDGDPATRDEFEQRYPSPDQLKTLQDGYKRFLDLTILFTALGYTLQIMDALTYAHLKNFDVSPDISLNVQPIIAPGYAGIGLVMQFR